MVLKFCAGFFSSEASEASSATSGSSSLTSFASNSDVLATKREGSLQKQVLSEILLDVRDAKWEKEFRVHFDGSIATGLGFQSLESAATSLRFGRRNSTSSFKVAATAAAKSEESPMQGDYECVVREIVPDGLAAEHNARCQSLGDYSRLITPGLRVRKVNSDDVAGVAYDQVLQKLRAAMPSFFITFADVRSRRVSESAAVRLEAPASFRPRESISATGIAPSAIPTPLLTRRNSSIGLPFTPDGSDAPSVIRLIARRSSTSSIMFLHGGSRDNTARNGDRALVGDLEAKTKDVTDQLQRVKQQMLDLQRESERVEQEKRQLVQERDAIAAAKSTLEAERLQLFEERDAVVASNKLLLSQRQSTSDLLVEREQRETSRLRDELEAARHALAQLQHQHDQTSNSQSDLEHHLADQRRICDEHAKRVAQLRHENEELQLAWKELQLEHTDSTQHVDELHTRLVQAQSQQKAAEQELEFAKQELARKTLQLSELTEGIQTILTGTSSQLDRILQHQEVPVRSAQQQQQQQLASLRQVQDERRAIEKHRDELLVEASRCEHLLHSSQLEVEELAASNAALRREIASLRSEIEVAQRQEREQQAQVESQHLVAQQHSAQTHDELMRQIRALEALCDSERAEKQQLRAALDTLEASARAKLDAHVRDQEALAQFKQQLVNGVAVTKHGTRGSPHARVLFSDVGCRWISWKPPSAGMSLASPRADAKVDTRDFVEVLAGASTDVFQRHKPETPGKCLSLVFVHPCRTLDVEAESVEKCQQLLRGFRLLLQDVAGKREQES